MRRIGDIREQVVALDNLYAAYYKARKGKRRRPDVARFSLDLERNLLALQRELEELRKDTQAEFKAVRSAGYSF